MARTANLSILGLFQWDNGIFDLFEIPDELDLDILKDNILSELAELEILYTNPTVMKSLIGIWSKKQKPVWEKLYETTQYDYNPIENYNRTETSNDSGSKQTGTSGSDTTNGSTGTINGGHDTVAGQSLETMGGTDDNLHKIASYDETDLIDQYSDTTTYGKTRNESHSNTTTYGKTENSSGQSTTTYGKTETESNSGTHSMNAHGNIGVTTTQGMIRQEREIDKFNLYNYIIEEFKMRFCILVY